MILVLEILAVLFMASIMFVAIWGFITLNHILGQMKYRNYLLEKLNHNVYMLGGKCGADTTPPTETTTSELQVSESQVSESQGYEPQAEEEKSE